MSAVEKTDANVFSLKPAADGDPKTSAETDFLSHLRHELRTPLNAIIGYSELLLEDAEDFGNPSIEKDLKQVHSAAKRLLESVNTQLRSGLIEAGDISLSEMRHAMRTVLDQVLGYVAIVREEFEDAGSEDYLDDVGRIDLAARRMTTLVDHGLTSESVAAGRIIMPTTEPGPERKKPAPVEVPETVKEAETTLLASLTRSDPSALTGRVLVVDDNQANREILERRLRQQGHEVTLAENGRQALDILADEDFDVVLLDIMMPEVSGYQVLQTLRDEDLLSNLPIIMISALDDLESVVQCINLGAVDHLPKPFNPVILNARIRACLEMKRLRDQVMNYLSQIEKELKTARDLQMGMVPTDFGPQDHAEGVELYASLAPAHRVGGDFYDFFYGDDSRLYFVIGDVSGKGIPAALNMARTKTLFRMVASRASGKAAARAEELLHEINDELANDNPSLTFVTVLLGILNPLTGTVDLANGGHVHPFIVKADGTIHEPHPDHGIPLGLRQSFVFKGMQFGLSPGDTICLITDGVTAAMNNAEALFGTARLVRALKRAGQNEPKALVQHIRRSIAEFTAGQDQFDDITLLSVRYNPLIDKRILG